MSLVWKPKLQNVLLFTIYNCVKLYIQKFHNHKQAKHFWDYDILYEKMMFPNFTQFFILTTSGKTDEQRISFILLQNPLQYIFIKKYHNLVNDLIVSLFTSMSLFSHITAVNM